MRRQPKPPHVSGFTLTESNRIATRVFPIGFKTIYGAVSMPRYRIQCAHMPRRLRLDALPDAHRPTFPCRSHSSCWISTDPNEGFGVSWHQTPRLKKWAGLVPVPIEEERCVGTAQYRIKVLATL